VDAVRLMNSDLQRRPHEGPWKILLVPYVEELTVQAANAFLKTLEEPPAQVVILLTTRDAELVLPTIRSRCQPLPMRPLAVRRVAEALRSQWGRDDEESRLLARLSGGRIGWAIRAVEDETLLQRRSEALEAHHRALRANRAERLLMAADLSKDEHAIETLQTWAGWWRDMLLVQSGTSGRISHIDQQAELEHVASRATREQTRRFLRDIQHLMRTLEQTNASPQLVWEVLLLKLPMLDAEKFEGLKV
jgi:DNA polymerase-3 subunit delta'